MKTKNCVICGSTVCGAIIPDFKFDNEKTEINWVFCRNCSITWAVKLILCNLNNNQYKKLFSIHGMTFLLHDDFYDEDGNALQSH
jgi:hypothetical protein